MYHQVDRSRHQFPNSSMPYQNMRSGPRNFPVNANNRNPPFPRRLMRQVASKKLSDTVRIAYLMEIFEHPLGNEVPSKVAGGGVSSHKNAVLKSPWITIRNQLNRTQEIVIPLSFSQCLLNYILSCADENLENLAVKDTSRDLHESLSDDADKSQETFRHIGTDVFDIQKLANVEFKDDELNYYFKICTQCPVDLKTEDGNFEDEIHNIPHRWISCGTLQSTDETVSVGNQRVRENTQIIPPWSKLGYIQLYGQLLPDLAVFLTDVNLRYRNIDVNPDVKPIFSVSGDRQFFFDLRNTRWGHRLHISQVTDLHRNIIGIPVETLVTFRDRIDTLIKLLNLEEGTDVRKVLEKHSAPQRHWRPPQRYRQNFSGPNQFRQRPIQGEDSLLERQGYSRQNNAPASQKSFTEAKQLQKASQQQKPNFAQQHPQGNRKPNLIIAQSSASISAQENKKVQPKKHIKFAEQQYQGTAHDQLQCVTDHEKVHTNELQVDFTKKNAEGNVNTHAQLQDDRGEDHAPVNRKQGNKANRQGRQQLPQMDEADMQSQQQNRTEQNRTASEQETEGQQQKQLAKPPTKSRNGSKTKKSSVKSEDAVEIPADIPSEVFGTHSQNAKHH